MQPDAVAALVAYLRADAEVAGLVMGRVCGAELPPQEAAQMPRKAVVVAASGGSSIGPGARSYLPVGLMQVDVRCYGETQYEAMRVFRAVHGALKRLGRRPQGEALLHAAYEGAGPLQTREPDVGWPMVLAVWQLLVAEMAIA